MWVDADVEYVGSVGDTVVVLWHSYNDLPDTFGLVYFGVIPYDWDEGWFDSILVRLDNKIPRIAVNPIVGDSLIGRSRYSGFLIWRSGLDLPN